MQHHQKTSNAFSERNSGTIQAQGSSQPFAPAQLEPQIPPGFPFPPNRNLNGTSSGLVPPFHVHQFPAPGATQALGGRIHNTPLSPPPISPHLQSAVHIMSNTGIPIQGYSTSSNPQQQAIGAEAIYNNGGNSAESFALRRWLHTCPEHHGNWSLYAVPFSERLIANSVSHLAAENEGTDPGEGSEVAAQ